MKKINKVSPAVKFFLNLGKTQTILNHRFDRGLGGLGFNEFLILFYLDQSSEQKLRRVDLAEKVGLTASGVTRLLLPMEKIGLVKSGPIDSDARVRFVLLSASGQQKLLEALERLELFAEEIVPKTKIKEIDNLSETLLEISGRALMV
jgi:DNA-binding MarR family transcriptional regulator